MCEFGFAKAKDIVNVYNATKQFKILDSDNNLIIEGKGSDIYDFLNYASIIVECKIAGLSYNVNVNDGRRLGDCPVLHDNWEENGILYYQIRLPFKFSRVEENNVYVKRN